MKVELKTITTQRGDDLFGIQQTSDDGRKDIGQARCWKDIDSFISWVTAAKEEIERVHGIKLFS